MNMALQYRPLGEVKSLLEQIGEDITYAYEDLVFVRHNHFLLQFGTTGDILWYFANVETLESDALRYYDCLEGAATEKGITLRNGGLYRLSEGANENISLEFLPAASPQSL
jgi:hypothetical protein